MVGSSTSPTVERCFAKVTLSSCAALGIILAGISSHPISNRNSPSAFAVALAVGLFEGAACLPAPFDFLSAAVMRSPRRLHGPQLCQAASRPPHLPRTLPPAF